MNKKKKLQKEQQKEEVQRFLPKESPRGQPIGNRRFKILSSKIKPIYNWNDL